MQFGRKKNSFFFFHDLTEVCLFLQPRKHMHKALSLTSAIISVRRESIGHFTCTFLKTEIQIEF